MESEILRTALAPSAECLSIEQLGRYADGALGAEEHKAAAGHIRRCLNCQAELALLHAVTSTTRRPFDQLRVVPSLVEGQAQGRPEQGRETSVRTGEEDIQPTMEILGADRASASCRRRWFHFRMHSVAAVAAVLLVGIAIGSFYLLVARKAPELPSSVTTIDEVTRSLAVSVRGPVGDQAEAPRRFEWLEVDRAVRYEVRLMEVDRREVWSTSTSALGVDLPQPVRTSIAPARTLLWDVTAYDASGAAIAQSGAQSFRFVPR